MGRAPCCDKANVKKGPWSPEEDEKLKDYIQTHGTGGNWIALPKKAGLRRCGKSCRLRWLNYLRPNIKHGEFSDDEDKVICDLFARIGSRWSVMAAQLPGRTDNDIKNYWNTKLKKKMTNRLNSMSEIRKPNLHYLQSTFNSNSTNYSYPSLSVFQTSSCNVKINNAQLSPPPPPPQSSSYIYSTTDHQTLSIPSSPSTAIAVSDHTHNHHGYLGLGQMESYQGVKDSSTPVMFSGDQASSSSNSDGSCQYTEYGSSVTANTVGGYEYDQKNIRSDSCYREFGENLDHKEKGYYGDASLDSSLEEIKQLISTNLCSSNIDNNLNFFVEETKDVEKVMMYY